MKREHFKCKKRGKNTWERIDMFENPVFTKPIQKPFLILLKLEQYDEK